MVCLMLLVCLTYIIVIFYRALQAKATNALKAIAKVGKLTPHLEQCIIGARSMAELEHYVSKIF